MIIIIIIIIIIMGKGNKMYIFKCLHLFSTIKEKTFSFCVGCAALGASQLSECTVLPQQNKAKFIRELGQSIDDVKLNNDTPPMSRIATSYLYYVYKHQHISEI